MAATYPRALRLFSRNVRLYLITATLIGFTFIGGVYPVLFNLFLLRLHYAAESIGLFNAAGLLASSIGCLPAAALGRRWGSRRAMIAGLSLAAVAYVLLPQAEIVPAHLRTGWLLLTDALGALGIVAYVVNGIPFLTSATGRAECNHVFAVQAALWPLTGFAGSQAAGLLPGVFARSLHVALRDATPYRYPLLIAAVLLITAVLALLATHEGGAARAAERRGVAGRAPLGVFALLAVVLLLQVGGEGAATTFFNVYLDARPRVATALIGTLVAAGQLLAVVAALAMPLLAAVGHRAHLRRGVGGHGALPAAAGADPALGGRRPRLHGHERPGLDHAAGHQRVPDGGRGGGLAPGHVGRHHDGRGTGVGRRGPGRRLRHHGFGLPQPLLAGSKRHSGAAVLFGAYVRVARGEIAPYPALDTAQEAR